MRITKIIQSIRERVSPPRSKPAAKGFDNNLYHVWHVWMNRRNQGREAGEAWEHSLYEFKGLLQFLEYGHKQIAEAFEGKLPTSHRQCSRTAPEPIIDNKLKCCLGKEVMTCPILLSLKTTIDEERARVLPFNGDKPYSSITDEQVYRAMAATCGWHIYSHATGIKEGFHGVDTSEGYLLTAGDRMFWDRVYSSMAGGDPDGESDDQGEGPTN